MVEGVGDHACEYMTGGRAVILGPTGRNFAAGMSGGMAFVHDPEGIFPRRLNTEMVAIEPLTDDDKAWLHDRVDKHHHETGSAIADRLLGDWRTSITQFVKVMPVDYRRVLQAQAEARATGQDETEAIMAAARG